ncbi:MAG: hypothetical protein NZM25_09885 [Leptospiraceae bacterium]|nr:hypothetical protein [Leptospiraceae bacterium]MDW8306468.1 hypothetical protein [Leptospiraceae bacterium]
MPGIVLIYKKTFLESQEKDELHNKLRVAAPELWEEILLSHEAHLRSVERFYKVLELLNIPYAAYERSEEAVDLENSELVVTLGGDGTFIHASHYLRSTPLLGLNSAPGFSVGHYCFPFPQREETLIEILRLFFEGRLAKKKYPRLAVVHNGKTLDYPVINDILIAESYPAATSRYLLSYQGRREVQKSSGLWISTPSGVGAGYGSAGGLPFSPGGYICGFVVREPYVQNNYRLRNSIITEDELSSFQVVSAMSQGRFFLDGSHLVFPFPAGDVLTFKRHPHDLISLDFTPFLRQQGS